MTYLDEFTRHGDLQASFVWDREEYMAGLRRGFPYLSEAQREQVVVRVLSNITELVDE